MARDTDHLSASLRPTILFSLSRSQKYPNRFPQDKLRLKSVASLSVSLSHTKATSRRERRRRSLTLSRLRPHQAKPRHYRNSIIVKTAPFAATPRLSPSQSHFSANCSNYSLPPSPRPVRLCASEALFDARAGAEAGGNERPISTRISFLSLSRYVIALRAINLLALRSLQCTVRQHRF